MDIYKDSLSYKHLEEFIKRNLPCNLKVIEEINIPIDMRQLEESLVPFICKLSSNSKTFKPDKDCDVCEIDFDNSENDVIEISDDDTACDEINNLPLLGSGSILNRKVKSKPFELYNINGNYKNGVTKQSHLPNSYFYNKKLCKKSTKWNSCKIELKSQSSFKSQIIPSQPKRTSNISGKSEVSSQENDNKSGNFRLKNTVKAHHILKEKNHHGSYRLQRNVKRKLDCHIQNSVSSNLSDNRTHFTQKAKLENSSANDNRTVKQNTQERTCKSDDSDSDEELMKVPIAVQSDRDSYENLSHQKASKVSSTSCLSLDKIIEARKFEMENAIIFKNQDLTASESNEEEECENNELLQLINPYHLNASMIQHDRIADHPPGLQIFDLRKCYKYFCLLHGLSLQSCGFIGENRTAFDKKLVTLSEKEFEDMIVLGAIKIHIDSTACKEALLEYLFKVLSLHNNETVTYAIKDIFIWYIKSSVTSKYRSICWCPSVTEVIAAVLNYGVIITDSCPVRNILHNAEKTFTCTMHDCLSVAANDSDNSLVTNGINNILEIFTLFLEQKHMHVYSQEEICDFILLLCWLSLDVHLLNNLIKLKFERCIAAGLELISVSDWPDKMKYLAEQLAELGGHHRNILYVTLILPASERGIHLQQAVSFLAVQYLLKAENPCFFADVTPFMLLDFLKLNPLHHVKDYFLLHSVVSLLDLCVGSKVLPLYRNALQEICDITLSTFGKIRETLQCLEETKVKDLLIRLYTKWNFFVRSLPYRKKTIFKYSSSTEQDVNMESDD